MKSPINWKSLNRYLDEIKNTTHLSPEKESLLADRIKEGDQAAIDELVIANLKFVIPVCQIYQGKGVPIADLVNEGNIGLITAAKKFDKTKNSKLISYAVWWIRQSVLAALAEQGHTSKLPINVPTKINFCTKASAKLEQKLGRVPTTAEIAEVVGMDEKRVNDLLNAKSNSLSLDEPIGQGENKYWVDKIADKNNPAPDERISSESLSRELDKAMSCLNKDQKRVIQLRFGLGTGHPRSQKDVAEIMGLSKERVRQIKETAFSKLRHPARIEILKKLTGRG